MASPYDAYRFNPAEQGDPWRLGADPRQYYAPSSSLWGNFRARAPEGVNAAANAGAASRFAQFGIPFEPRTLPSVPGANMMMAANPGLMTMTAPVGSFANAFTNKGNFFENLGSGDAWRNFATFGMSGSKEAQDEAEHARARAVDDWRLAQQERLGSLLSGAGADVQQDLGPELAAALGAGGRLGDMEAVKNQMTKFQQRYQQYMLGRQRAGQARQVDAMMSDPQRAQQREQGISAARNQGLSDIAESYRIGQRENAFNQARRGMQGSSVDVEKQGLLGRGRDAAATQLQSGLDAQRQQYRLGDEQQRNQLMGLIYSDDPNMASAFQNTLQGIQRQGQTMQEQSDVQRQQAARQAATSTGYSQAIGGALSAASRPLGYYLEHSAGA
jgi:hypothetical protein